MRRSFLTSQIIADYSLYSEDDISLEFSRNIYCTTLILIEEYTIEVAAILPH